ncbi:MAG: hypothetical protein IPH13_09025 [Planctomycetes bacterium]|nr:hypothetical protein [Planctomycetota bacterium]
MGTAALFFGIVSVVLAMFGTATCFVFLEFFALPCALLAIGLACTELSRSGWRSWKQQPLTSEYAVPYAWRALGLGVVSAIWSIVVLTRDFGPLFREWNHQY